MSNKRAKVTAKEGFKHAPEGHTVVVEPEGTILEGKTAEIAIAQKKAQAMGPAKKQDAPETKAQKKAPENK